jgi:glycosyltransferase involved in cell wall biosynthesis
MTSVDDYTVLHVAVNPITGPLSQMLTLARYQHRETPGLVHMAFVCDSDWASKYWGLVQNHPVKSFFLRIPKLPASMQYLSIAFFRPIARWTRKLEKRNSSQIAIHFHTGAWRAGVFFPLPDVPACGAVVTFRGFPLPSMLFKSPGRKLLHSFFAKFLMRYNPELVTVDNVTVKRSKELFGISEERFTYIPNGVDIPPEKCKIRSHENGEFLVGFVGQLHEYKGYTIAMEAVRLCRRQGFNVRMLLAGLGPDEEKIRKICAQEREAFDFLGYVENARTTVISRLDALVLPSKNEGMSNVILEAMAECVPVLASPVGAAQEMIVDGWNGFLVEQNAEIIADRIKILVKDEHLGDCFRRRSRELVESRYSIQAASSQYRIIYERALARRAGCRPLTSRKR